MAADANLRAVTHFVRGLLDAGLAAAVVSPGARNTALAWAFADAADRGELSLHVVLDERAAAFLALGRARALRGPVALACTSGSAGAHWLPAVVEAAEGRVPLVLCTADRPAELHGVGAPQAMDQRRLFGAFTRFDRDLPAPGAAPDALWRAVGTDAAAAATGPVPGPAHVNLAFREPLWAPGLSAPALTPRPAPLAGRARLDPAAIERLAQQLRGAQRGLIHCGPHASDDPEFGAAVHALGDALGWPVVAEFGSGARLTAAAGRVTRLDPLARAPGFGARWAPDRVLRFGRAPHSRAARGAWRAAAPTLVQVDPAGARQDPDLHANTIVKADPTAVAQALLDGGARSATRPEWLRGWQALEAKAGAALDAAADDGAWGAAAARAVALGLPAGGLLHAASSLAFRDLDTWTPLQTQAARALVARGVNGIDGTLSAAVGHALSAPTALLTGDLAFLHDLSGLLLMAAERPPLVVVVVDNGGGGIFDHLPLAQAPKARFERLFITPQAADLPSLCAGAGVPCVTVPAPELRAAVAQAFAAGGPHVLRLVVDRAEDRARRARAWAAVAQAIEGVSP